MTKGVKLDLVLIFLMVCRVESISAGVHGKMFCI